MEMEYSLYQKLREYKNSETVPFHMPGHMRNSVFESWGFPVGMDITEINGFDNLYHASGVLKNSQERLSRLFGTKASYYLVNGSTAGILASVSTCVRRNGQILMARNSHKSAFNAVYLRGLQSRYITPRPSGEPGIHGDIRPETVRHMLESCPDAEAVFVTSPTYDGVVSDIRGISDVVHEKDLPLIVDEAHGAHLYFSPYFPSSAVQEGADLVIQSFHKTLPSLTQSAVLHVCSDRIDTDVLERFLSMYQTSSPSYILMAGLDRCVSFLEEEGKAAFAHYTEKLDYVRDCLAENRIFSLLEPDKCHAYDRSKILLRARVAGGGTHLAELLRQEYHIEVEMEAADYVLALTSVGNRDEDFDRLAGAVTELDRKWEKKENGGNAIADVKELVTEQLQINVKEPVTEHLQKGSAAPEVVTTIAQAMEGAAEGILLSESAGHVSSEFVWIYPPGIPLIVPGERISGHVVKQLENAGRAGLAVQGPADRSGKYIKVMVTVKTEQLQVMEC